MERKDLEKKTWKELRRLAKDLRVSGWQRMKRKNLTEAILQKKAKVPRVVEAVRGLPEVPELPETYGKTRLALLAVDPRCVHAYWEIAEKDLILARKKLGPAPKDAKCVLRVYDVTHIDFEKSGANCQWDIEFEPGRRNWYINLSSPNRSLFVELGLRGAKGKFVPLARSNFVHTPPDKRGAPGEEKWLLVEGDFEEVRAVPAPGLERLKGRKLPLVEATERPEATSPGFSKSPPAP